MGRAKQWMIEDDGFSEFLELVLELDELEDAAVEVTKIVLQRGRNSLTPQQEAVFQEQVLDTNVIESCKRCENSIPWCEMVFAQDNGGLCSFCYQVSTKND